MRRFVFALMVLLLPLRGWAVDAMAIQMVLPGGMHHAAAGAPAHGSGHHVASAPADHRHVPQATKAGDCTELPTDDNAAQDNHCQTCPLCQACHNVAMTLPALVLSGVGPLKTLPPLAARHFASAERALDLKPPIS